MTIKISPTLKTAISTANSLPKDQIESVLKAKANGKCHLCDADFNYASDDIEVDHDIPVDAAGGNLIGNLNLAHVECNRFKKAQGSKDVRNLLRFKRFYNLKGGSLAYSGALEFFNVSPEESLYEEKEGEAVFQFTNGQKNVVPIFKSTHGSAEYKYCFVSIPIVAIFNDDECQPRLLKLNHAFSIATDLATNPLHEAPTCRLERLDDGKVRVLMFDGQHKALANWLRHETSIVFKIYLNMTRQQATGLINSIQSKIKKLPLTPFELAGKLSSEYADKLAIYENLTEADQCSEEGFVTSLPAAERATAKKEIEAAVLQEIADDPSLSIAEIVELRGKKLSVPWRITETAFQNKLLKELAHTAPLPSAKFRGGDMQAARIRERQNIVTFLNVLYEKVYQDLDANSSENERERAKRMSYQSTLKYVASLIKKIVDNRMPPTSKALVFVERTPTVEQVRYITDGIERLVSHPVWTAGPSTEGMPAVIDAMVKNQGVELAMEARGLTPAYCLGL